MLESQIESRICDYAKQLGVLTRKFTSPSRRGVSDRLFIFKCGRTAYLEVKRAGEQPTPLQKRELLTLRAQGAPASWCDSVLSGTRLISRGVAGDFAAWKEAPIS